MRHGNCSGFQARFYKNSAWNNYDKDEKADPLYFSPTIDLALEVEDE